MQKHLKKDGSLGTNDLFTCIGPQAVALCRNISRRTAVKKLSQPFHDKNVEQQSNEIDYRLFYELKCSNKQHWAEPLSASGRNITMPQTGDAQEFLTRIVTG
jgi:hypothetical protein